MIIDPKLIYLQQGFSAGEGVDVLPSSPGDTWQMSGDIFGCHDLRVLLASSGERPGMVLCRTALRPPKNDQAQDCHGGVR